MVRIEIDVIGQCWNRQRNRVLIENKVSMSLPHNVGETGGLGGKYCVRARCL